ncbi:MAG: NUDIX pyrophosphatase [Ignavibacteriaceae bacterium]
MNIISNLIEAHIFREMNGVIEFLLLKRSPVQYVPNIWQMVSGKIKTGEKAFECALREIKEETGLTPGHLWVVPNVNSLYSAENDSITILPVFAAKIKFESQIQLSEEHVAYKWLSSDEAKLQLAWEGQRKSVEIINDYFVNKKNIWAVSEIKF